MAKASVSGDSVNSFSKPVIINEKESLGRVDIAIHNGKAYISWMEKDSTQTNLELTSFDSDNELSETETISKVNGSRQTGFPQMEVLGDDLIFAWTDIDQSPSRIKTVRIPLAVPD